MKFWFVFTSVELEMFTEFCEFEASFTFSSWEGGGATRSRETELADVYLDLELTLTLDPVWVWTRSGSVGPGLVAVDVSLITFFFVELLGKFNTHFQFSPLAGSTVVFNGMFRPVSTDCHEVTTCKTSRVKGRYAGRSAMIRVNTAPVCVLRNCFHFVPDCVYAHWSIVIQSYQQSRSTDTFFFNFCQRLSFSGLSFETYFWKEAKGWRSLPLISYMPGIEYSSSFSRRFFVKWSLLVTNFIPSSSLTLKSVPFLFLQNDHQLTINLKILLLSGNSFLYEIKTQFFQLWNVDEGRI